MKLQYKGIVVTGILIIVGIAILLPAYFQKRAQSVVMLSFSIVDNDNLPQWCNDLFSMLRKYDMKGTIFIAGKIAEKYPNCVSQFASNSNFDIGSSTYNYSNLISISDYSRALEEVRDGKKVVDDIGKINSSLFKAPYGSTDQNIYSLLSRSGIIADFSYANQYNKYENGQFLKFDLAAYNGSKSSTELTNMISSSGSKPVIINFDNSLPISHIDDVISTLKSKAQDIHFANPSELTNLILTAKNEVNKAK